jgi:glycosyltransferase involved in cell wall biosynthesis
MSQCIRAWRSSPILTPARGESRAEVRARLGFSRDDIVIGTVARLAEHKGHDDLLDALAPDLTPNLKLLWVGDGWWRRRLLDKARSLKLTVRELDLNADTITHYPEAPRPLPSQLPRRS